MNGKKKVGTLTLRASTEEAAEAARKEGKEVEKGVVASELRAVGNRWRTAYKPLTSSHTSLFQHSSLYVMRDMYFILSLWNQSFTSHHSSLLVCISVSGGPGRLRRHRSEDTEEPEAIVFTYQNKHCGPPHACVSVHTNIMRIQMSLRRQEESRGKPLANLLCLGGVLQLVPCNCFTCFLSY